MTKEDLIKMEFKGTDLDNTIYGNLNGKGYHDFKNFLLSNGKSIDENFKALEQENKKLKAISVLHKKTIIDLSGELQYMKAILKKYGLE
jgi:hypothetical protein